jgi:hypothetical protein
LQLNGKAFDGRPDAAMAPMRIIPGTDDGAFPYEEARYLLEHLPGVTKTETDIPAMVAAGTRIGWPKEMIDAHWELMRRGRCFTFHVDGGISCRLWEDNIFFGFSGRAHEECCLPVIEDLARQLRCRVLKF